MSELTGAENQMIKESMDIMRRARKGTDLHPTASLWQGVLIRLGLSAGLLLIALILASRFS
jgi:hypothetical protein